MPPSAETGLIAATEAGVTPEKNTREDVVKAFKYAQAKFQGEIGHKPFDQLTEEEKADLNALNGAFTSDERRTGADFTKGKYTYTNIITDPSGGPDIRQEESVPVEGLISFLETKLVSLRNGSEKNSVQKNLDILKHNSQTYEEAHPDQKIDIGAGEVDNPTMFARKRQEAKFISQDHRATGSEEGDYNKALTTLRRRRELVLPPKETPKIKPKVDSAIPQAQADQRDPDSYNVLEAAEEDSEETSDTGQEEPGRDQQLQTQGGIPIDQVLYDVEEPEEDEEGITPTATTAPATSIAVNTPPEEIERTSIDIASVEDVVGKQAALQAKKDINERLSQGKLWEIWRWPAKLALRLSQGGVENIQQERLRRAAVDNNLLTLPSVTGGAAAVNEALEKSEEQRNAVLDRMRRGRIIEGIRSNGQIIEARRVVEGELKNAIMRDIITPIITPDHPDAITGTSREQANEIRRRMSTFVKNHLTDPQVQELFGTNASDYGFVAESFATDILEKAQVIKANMEKHNLALEEYSKYVDLHFGLARGLHNTDTRSYTDRAVAWARRRQNEHLTRGVQEAGRVSGWILNPAVVGISMSLATEGILKGLGTGSKFAGVTGPLAGLMGGAAVAGARRYVEIGGHRKMQNAELAMGEAVPEKQHSRNILGKLYERTAGMYRREDLVQFRYDSVKVSELISGTNGQEISDPTDPNNPQARRVLESVDQLLSQNDNEAIARRMEEIRIRINRGLINRTDLITFSNKTKVNQELNLLHDAADRLEQALRDNGADIDELRLAADRYWQDTFTLDQQRKDSAFNSYRWRQTGGAALMGGAMGLVAGAGVQQGAAEVARHFTGAAELPIIGGMFKPGQTLFEKGEHVVGSAVGHTEWGTGPVSVDSFVDLYKSGGKINLNDAITIQANPDHTITYINPATGQPHFGFPKTLVEANGHLVTSEDPNLLPQEMKTWLNSEIGLRSQIKEAFNSGQPKTIPVGKANIDINSSAATVSVGSDMVHGTVGTDGTLHLSSDNLDALKNTGGELLDNGFPDSQFIKSQSILDQAREVFNQPDSTPRTVTIPNLGDVTITPHSGEILIQPSTGPLAGTEIPGIFKADGTLHLDLPHNSNLDLKEVQQILEKTGFTGVKVEDVPGQPTTREIPGQEIPGQTITKDVLEYFREQNVVEKAKRLFWHDNSTPMHLNERGILVGADGKELQLHHFLKDNGTVTLDISQMVSQMTPEGGVNWDLTVDSQYSHLLKDITINPDGSRNYQNFEFLITPNDAADNAREIIKIPVTGNGNFDIKANSDLHQFFDTTTGKPVQLARFIEVAHVEPDGTRTILATSVGKGIDQITTVTPPTVTPTQYITNTTPGIHTLDATLPDAHTYSLDLTPPHATEIIPPTVEAPPFIPIPFARMHPLETLNEEILILYGYGGSYSGEGLGWLGGEEWGKRRSQTLEDNPDAKLDEAKEVADYLSKLDPKYREELEQMDSAIGIPMSSETRVVITIPAFGEGKIIKRTLEQFLNQKDKNGNPLNPNLFEIIVYENDTETRPKDETEAEIQKFKQAHPEINVHYAYKRWSQDDIDNHVNTIGNGRRYNCDLALLRSNKRISRPGELIIINNDADLEGITNKYVADIITEFDSKDYLDYVVGKRNLPQWALTKPNIRAGQRMWEIRDALMRHGAVAGVAPNERQKGWQGMIGENSAMRASIYAAVGGYNAKANLAEDQELGAMMRLARNYDDRRSEYLNRLQTIKNPRRYLTYMVANKPLIHMYNDYHENKDIRNLNNQQLLDRIPDTFDIVRFQLDADAIYQQKGDFQHYKNNEYELMFQKMMGSMGVEYKLENKEDGDGVTRPHVVITNVDRLLEGLKPRTGNQPNNQLIQNMARSTSPTPTAPPTTLFTPTPVQITPIVENLDRQAAINLPIPTPLTISSEKTVDLSSSLQKISDQLDRANANHEAEVSYDYPIADKFIWQEVIYGPPRLIDGDNCYRGYLMVEPEDMPTVLPILMQLGQQRKAQGKRLDFKWLKRTLKVSTDATAIPRIGQYKELGPTDPRIAIYGDTPDEIQEILATLANNPEWQNIEARRTTKFGGAEYAPRRPGTNALIINGREYRSLNYNNRPGYSEDEAHDLNWRANKQGTPTIIITPTQT